MIRGPGPMSPLDRLVIGAIGALAGAGSVGLLAYAGPILRWECAQLDRLIALIS